jgi:transcriptional antiterminator RfaH
MAILRQVKMFWAVAITKPANENRAIVNLDRQGYITYLPKYMSRIGSITKIKILFPRYLFVQIDQQWHSINSTFGVSRVILGRDNRPAIVSDRIISDLKMREDSKGLISLPQPSKFRPGEKVRVVNGPMSGYDAIYDGMRPNDRVRILIELLGQQAIVELDEKDLAAVAVENSYTDHK